MSGLFPGPCIVAWRAYITRIHKVDLTSCHIKYYIWMFSRNKQAHLSPFIVNAVFTFSDQLKQIISITTRQIPPHFYSLITVLWNQIQRACIQSTYHTSAGNRALWNYTPLGSYRADLKPLWCYDCLALCIMAKSRLIIHSCCGIKQEIVVFLP